MDVKLDIERQYTQSCQLGISARIQSIMSQMHFEATSDNKKLNGNITHLNDQIEEQSNDE